MTTADRLGRAAVVAGVAVAGFLLADKLLMPVQVLPAGTRVLDFAYYANISRAFWAGEAGNPYSADALLRAFGRLSGRDTQQAMPIGVCPSSFLLWWPFATLAERDLAAAHAAWVGLSLAAVVGVFWLLVRDDRGRFPPLALALTLAVGLSQTSGLALIGGQITFVAVAALIALWRPTDSWADAGVAAGLLLVLAIKPTYLFPAGVLVLALRRWRVGLVGLAAGVVANGVALGLMDAGTLAEFLASLRLYSSGRVPPHFADTFVPGSMASFTSAFAPYLSQPAAFQIAQLLSGLGTLGVLGLAATRRVPARQAFAAAVGVLLVFAPYLGSYEDLLVLAVVGVLVRDGARWPKLLSGWGLMVPVAVLFFNRQWVLAGLPLVLHWGLKAGLIAGMLWLGRRLPARRASEGGCRTGSDILPR